MSRPSDVVAPTSLAATLHSRTATAPLLSCRVLQLGLRLAAPRVGLLFHPDQTPEAALPLLGISWLKPMLGVVATTLGLVVSYHVVQPSMSASLACRLRVA